MPQLSETSLVIGTLHGFVAEYPQVKRWLVAYSGGLDSSVLLKALVELRLDVEVEAVHVNHGLSKHANAWQDHCQAYCQELGVQLHSQSVEIRRQGRGLEDAAREARYSVFESLMDADTALVMGHHADDQAETLVMRLVRGSGTRGMAGMQECRSLTQGILCRPLLSLEREQLRQQAQAWRLSWIDDESNDSDAFDRNFLRLAIMPKLKQRWPHLAQRAAQTAHWSREADQLVSEVAAEDLGRAQPRTERLGASLNWTVWRHLSDYRRGNLMRLWCESQRLDLPERVHLDELSAQFLRQSPDSGGEVRWGNVCIRYFRQRLYCLSASSVFLAERPTTIAGWYGEPMAWGGGEISLQPVAEGGFRLPSEGFEVSPRQMGERCHPSWRDRSQTLKKLLQESQLEPWLRGIVPCLRERHQLAVVGDLWHCQGWQAEGEQGYRLHWQLSDR